MSTPTPRIKRTTTANNFNLATLVENIFQAISLWLSLCIVLFAVIALFFWDPFMRHLHAKLTETELTNIMLKMLALKREIEELLGFSLGTIEKTSFIGRMWHIGSYLIGNLWFLIISVGISLGITILGNDDDSDSKKQKDEVGESV